MAEQLKKNYVLIDYENVQIKSLSLLSNEQFEVTVFLGVNNTKLSTEFVLSKEKLGPRAKYVRLEKAGGNALDFHIAFYLGKIVAHDPNGFFHIISKDKGFDTLITHLKSIKTLSARSESIEAMPCFAVTSKSTNKVADAKPLSENGKLAIKHLIGLKASKPRKLKTLTTTLQAKLGKNISKKTVENTINELLTMKYLTIEDQNASYNLPSSVNCKN
ncbi:PIN domain-containing protein [Methylotenera sp. L2L1]|uniref:PIN domain-containing protein n=1 Tax=Methylotenera sp. L2L1 TaxID=1502770 RepID=UPI00055BB232|nr:PIN domain-containing protein [Methylotenera sp. L2L1]